MTFNDQSCHFRLIAKFTRITMSTYRARWKKTGNNVRKSKGNRIALLSRFNDIPINFAVHTEFIAFDGPFACCSHCFSLINTAIVNGRRQYWMTILWSSERNRFSAPLPSVWLAISYFLGAWHLLIQVFAWNTCGQCLRLLEVVPHGLVWKQKNRALESTSSARVKRLNQRAN